MSKWKDKKVRIVQIVKTDSNSSLFALGTDDMVYKWDKEKGRWEKNWTEEDDE